MVGIYKIENIKNHHIYIGQSIDIEKRWKDHIDNYDKKDRYCYDYPLYRAMRRHGLNNFKFEVIEQCKRKELNNKEIYWISYYNSYHKGYNQTPGGSIVNIREFNIVDLNSIIDLLLNSTKSQEEIAKQFKTSAIKISAINKGLIYFDSKLSYPIRNKKTKRFLKNNKGEYIKKPSYKQLLKDFYEIQNKKKVAEKYNVSEMLIYKWCKELNIPCQSKKACIQKYEKEFLGMKPKEAKHICNIQQINPETGEIIATFDNAEDAAKKLNICRSALNSAIAKNKLYKGFIWKRTKIKCVRKRTKI